MASIGPELPPHLFAKRKRQAEEEAENVAGRSPSPEATVSRSPSGGQGEEKRRRVAGPTLPSAPSDERPPGTPPSGHPPEDGESSDDDGYGPALPSTKSEALSSINQHLLADEAPADPVNAKPQRDEWMTLPPTADGLSSRMDPTKLRARKFNTGKGARGPSHANASDNTVWTETPEQKRKRLQDEVMGVTKPASAIPNMVESEGPAAEDQETARRIKEYDEKNRGKSLYQQHKMKSSKESDDDPSKRAFDKEKDMGGGIKIGHAQRREMLNRASDFSSRFSSGSYL